MPKVFKQSLYLPHEVDPVSGMPYSDMTSQDFDPVPTAAENAPAIPEDPSGEGPDRSPAAVAAAVQQLMGNPAKPVPAKPQKVVTKGSSKTSSETFTDQTKDREKAKIGPTQETFQGVPGTMEYLSQNIPELQAMANQAAMLRKIAAAKGMAYANNEIQPPTNLTPLMQLTDAWTGSHFTPGYKPPADQESQMATLYKMAQEADAKAMKAKSDLIRPGFGEKMSERMDALKSMAGQGNKFEIKVGDLHGGGATKYPYRIATNDFLKQDADHGATITKLNEVAKVHAMLNKANWASDVSNLRAALARLAGEKGMLSEGDIRRTGGTMQHWEVLKRAALAGFWDKPSPKDLKILKEYMGKAQDYYSQEAENKIKNFAKDAPTVYNGDVDGPTMEGILRGKLPKMDVQLGDSEDKEKREFMDFLKARAGAGK